MTAQVRKFEINGSPFRATKSLFGGPKQYNGRGQWITAWYVKPDDGEFSNDGIFVGLTVAQLNRWIKAQKAQT